LELPQEVLVGDWPWGARTAHMGYLALENATMHVSKAGWARARREKQKNIHAHIRGVVSNYAPGWSDGALKGTQITYTPFRLKGFAPKSDFSAPPIIAASKVWFATDGRCFALSPIHDLTGIKMFGNAA